MQHERTVARDNTVSYANRLLQIEKTKWRHSLAGCKLKVYEQFPHGMCTTNADVINADLLAFLKS